MPKNLLFCAISLYLCRSKVVEVLTSFYHKLANYKKIAQDYREVFMATITLKLDTRRKNKNGEYPIVYSISHQSVSCTIPSGICIKESELYGDSKRMVRSIVANSDEINAQLYNLLRDYQDKLASLEQQNKVANMTASEIKRYILTADDELNDKTSFTDYAKRHLEKYSGNTRRTYEYTLRLLDQHFNGNVIFFKDITVGVLRDLEVEWGKTMGVSARSINFRNIRTIFNRAIDDEVTDNYPFRKFKIKVSHKDKDYLPVDCMKKLMELEFPETEYLNALTRDMFLLSFYLCGVNFNDIFSWGNEVLHKNKIVFVRKKIAYHEPEDLRKLDKGQSWVYVFQTTKEGNFRGSQEFEHDVDVSIEVEKFKAHSIKNRFGGKEEINV